MNESLRKLFLVPTDRHWTLVVEDDVGVARSLPRFMGRTCPQVRVAKSRTEARALLGCSGLYAALIDFVLPEGSVGIELAEFVGRMHPAAFVAIMSGAVDEELADRCFSLGLPLSSKVDLERSVETFIARAAMHDSPHEPFLAVTEALSAFWSLSQQETRVFREVVTPGAEDLASRLLLETSTVESHIASIVRKSRRSSLLEVARIPALVSIHRRGTVARQ